MEVYPRRENSLRVTRENSCGRYRIALLLLFSRGRASFSRSSVSRVFSLDSRFDSEAVTSKGQRRDGVSNVETTWTWKSGVGVMCSVSPCVCVCVSSEIGATGSDRQRGAKRPRRANWFIDHYITGIIRDAVMQCRSVNTPRSACVPISALLVRVGARTALFR